MKKLMMCAVLALLATGMMFAKDARAADQPFPPANPWSGDPAAIEAGKTTYWKFCVGCHGHKADGVSRFGDYAYDLRKFWRGYCNFVMIVLNGRPKKQMPPWGGYLEEQEIGEIAAYLESLAMEGAQWTGACTDY